HFRQYGAPIAPARRRGQALDRSHARLSQIQSPVLKEWRLIRLHHPPWVFFGRQSDVRANPAKLARGINGERDSAQSHREAVVQLHKLAASPRSPSVAKLHQVALPDSLARLGIKRAKAEQPLLVGLDRDAEGDKLPLDQQRI